MCRKIFCAIFTVSVVLWVTSMTDRQIRHKIPSVNTSLLLRTYSKQGHTKYGLFKEGVHEPIYAAIYGNLITNSTSLSSPETSKYDGSNFRERIIKKTAPILCLTESEPFTLLDVVVIFHPTQPIVGFHLFWQDDIDFPDDNEPCDHEVVWVKYDHSGAASEVFTYYHRNILRSTFVGTEEVRPKVFIEWGKHGTLTDNWKTSAFLWGSLLTKFLRLKLVGRRAQHYKYGANWPVYFQGSLAGYFTFSRKIDLVSYVKTTKIFTTKWANARISTVIHYNFCPKVNWPY